ncbi:MAG: hypothetical protein ACREBU_12535 [Nitrososphaera sp.]
MCGQVPADHRSFLGTYTGDRSADRGGGEGKEDQTLGAKDPATRRKDIDEGPGCPVVTQDISSVQTGNI